MSFCEHCAKGVIHEGTPAHGTQTLEGVETYVAKGGDGKKVVVIFSDVFGLALTNNKLLADSYAAHGFTTYVPDLFHGKPFSLDQMNKPDGFASLKEWFGDHDTKAILQEIAVPVMEAVHKLHPDATMFGVLGFCFGARMAFDMGFEGLRYCNRISVAHPSLVTIPDDLEKLRDQFVAKGGRFQVHSCDNDGRFPLEQLPVCDAVFERHPNAYERKHWVGCSHGFAVRCDLNDPQQRAGKEGAFRETVAFLRR